VTSWNFASDFWRPSYLAHLSFFRIFLL